MMKVFIVSTIVLATLATVEAGLGGGHSESIRQQDDHGNYAFSYDIVNGHGAKNGRKESGGPHGVVGSYYIGDIDGRHRTVHYVADKAGFRAQIKTNEPGTKTSHPAAAAFTSDNGNSVPSGNLHGTSHLAASVHAETPTVYTHLPVYSHGLGHKSYSHNVPYATHGIAAPVYGLDHEGYGLDFSLSHLNAGFGQPVYLGPFDDFYGGHLDDLYRYYK